MKTTFSNDCSRATKGGTLTKTLALVFLGLLATGCPAGRQDPKTVGPERIVIKGSNTIGEELAPRLIAEFEKQHPDLSIDLETKGSAAGIWGLIAGVCDIGASSRPIIKDEQQQAAVHGVQLNDSIIGSYGVAVVLHPDNPVGNLTKDQVRDIFTGAVRNWKEVGGPDAPVHLYIRNPVSGTYLGFRELAMEDKPYATNNVTELTNYAASVQAVSKDPNGIGYATIQLAGRPGVKAVSIAGVPPAISSVQEGKYPYARALHLFTDKAKEAGEAHDFVQFVLSARGQQILDEMGFVPHP
jgi:phosphate transport system substrate-binding protein